MNELEVISQYPRTLADEMMILSRRMTYLKLKSENTSESQLEALEDVSDFSDFIWHLFQTKHTTPFDFVRVYHFHDIERYIESGKDDD